MKRVRGISCVRLQAFSPIDKFITKIGLVDLNGGAHDFLLARVLEIVWNFSVKNGLRLITIQTHCQFTKIVTILALNATRIYPVCAWKFHAQNRLEAEGNLKQRLVLTIEEVQPALVNDLAIEAGLFGANHQRAGGRVPTFIEMNKLSVISSFNGCIPKAVDINRAVSSVEQINWPVWLSDSFVVEDLVVNIKIEISFRSFMPKHFLKINYLKSCDE